mgnify:CR=1 FL=1
MILKLLLIVGVIAAVYMIFFKQKPTISNHSKKPENENRHNEANDMVECSTCGVYCEIDEAILSDAKYYCSSECLTKAL